MKYFIVLLVTFLLISCKDEVFPKPAAQLKLEYPSATYSEFKADNFTFLTNQNAFVKSKNTVSKEIHYPKMKATVFLNYMPVANNIEALLTDAQKLTYDHVIKADQITEQPFVNFDNKVYGMFYEVGGNAATNVQFYATDSTKNFMLGSLYFYAKPNYDSILPAADYIKKDIRKIIETLKWE